MPEYEVAEVLSEKPHRTWDRDDGTVHYFKVKLTDGTEAEAGKKKADTPPEVGDRYKKLHTPGNPEYLATVSAPISDYKGGGKNYEADARGLRGKNASSALHAALSASEGKEISSDQVVALAGKFYDFIEGKAKVGE